MIRAVFIFILLLASVWLGVQLQHDPGYLLIAINHWTIEMTLWVAIAGLIFLFCCLHMLLLLLHWSIHLPTALSLWLAKRRSLKAQAKTRQGLIEFSEGHWLKAKNHLINALPGTDTPLLNYLTAARAAQEMGDNQLRDNYLREAQQSMPEAKIAVELTQAQLQLANRQWEQALATLKHLQDLAPRHPYVLKLLMHLYKEVKDWPQLIALLPELKRNKVVTANDYQFLQQNAYLQSINDIIKQDQPIALDKLIDALPKNLLNDAEIMAAYTRYLHMKHNDAKAESILRRCLKTTFSEDLIDIYGLVNSNENQLQFVESLVKKQPHSALLFLCLGRLSNAKQLWGKAKVYFEQSIDVKPTPVAYMELGKLLELLGDHIGARDSYQKGLLLATQENL